jgi:hypothetical protein
MVPSVRRMGVRWRYAEDILVVEGFRATFSSHAADVSRAAPTVQAQGSEAFRELLGNREMSCGCCSGHRSVAWLESGMEAGASVQRT